MKYIKDDITNCVSGLLLQGVNASGAMGSGVAGAIRRKWPTVYDYFCQQPTGEAMMGKFTPIIITEQLTVGNCYTQLYFGSDGKRYACPVAIELALKSAYEYATECTIDTVMLPKIGAGLGGLSWEDDVEPIVNRISLQYPHITTEIYYID